MIEIDARNYLVDKLKGKKIERDAFYSQIENHMAAKPAVVLSG